MLRCAATLCLSVILFAAAPAAAYTFFLDRLEIVYSGTSFVDEFDDGVPPPVGGGYNVVGTVGPESGSVLTLDQADAVPGQVPGTEVQVGIQLVGASSASPFSVSALYDLVIPDSILIEGQAVFLSYFDSNNDVHTVIAAFQSAPAFPLALSLIDFNTVTAVPTVLDVMDVSSLFTGSIDQVEVRLDVTAGVFADASIVVYDNDVEIDSDTLPTSAVLQGTVFPSGGFQVFMPEPGVEGLLAGSAVLAALARRRQLRRLHE